MRRAGVAASKLAPVTVAAPDQLAVLQAEIVQCTRCPRLVAHRQMIGEVKRRAYRGENYWSRPVPGFGDPAARLVLIGLAPGAHGANRTGRMFTGDRSGEFLYRALWETAFANQPDSRSQDDGLKLQDAYITAAVRCVPPDNKPLPSEVLCCRRYLTTELELLDRARVVVALGGTALQAYLSTLLAQGRIAAKAGFPFGHGRVYQPYSDGPTLITSYHPSQQNTSTKKLTAEMLREVFSLARSYLPDAEPNESSQIVKNV